MQPVEHPGEQKAAREKRKWAYQAYRDAARKEWERFGLTIPHDATVHIVADGGAYVQALVWVPELKEKADEEAI